MISAVEQRQAWLSEVCPCGHERRSHHGFTDGPCIAAFGDADATVCPCSAFGASYPSAPVEERIGASRS